jgi:hypothetical protein
MKFYCGKSPEERELAFRRACLAERKRRENWHKVFLWFPKRMEDGLCHWLEEVERKNTWWCNDYYLLGTPDWRFRESVFHAMTEQWRLPVKE